MTPDSEKLFIAFAGRRLIAKGRLEDVARAVKKAADRTTPPTILVFDARTSAPIELDLRGTVRDVLGRLPAAPAREGVAADDADAPRTPGRPKLGVVAREVTLLPRHWEWLATQRGGASATLRRLVGAAKRASADDDRRREAREAAYKFMNAMAGDEAGFEEACRALFAGSREAFEALVETWPSGIRDHAIELALRSFDADDAFA